MKNNRLVKVSSILFLITISLGCFPSHAGSLVDIEALLAIIPLLNADDNDSLDKQDQDYVEFAKRMHNACRNTETTTSVRDVTNARGDIKNDTVIRGCKNVSIGCTIDKVINRK